MTELKLKLTEGELSFADIQKRFSSRKEEEVRKIISSRTLKFLEDIGQTNWEKAQILAYWVFNQERNSTVCYLNNAFYIANRWNLPYFHKTISAIGVLWNGRHKYFEWITHKGFDNAKLFSELGVISSEEARDLVVEYKNSNRLYCFLDREIDEKLARRFGIEEEQIRNARLTHSDIFEKETTNNLGSGQYVGLPLRDDLKLI